MTPISAQVCVAGRELTEPRLSPDGRWLSVVEAGRPGIIFVMAIERSPTGLTIGFERALSTLPAPVAGRGLGGGCHHWLSDSSGVVYAAADGAVWFQPLSVDAPECVLSVAGTALVAPMIIADGDGRWCVVAVGDQAGVWARTLWRTGSAWSGGDVVRVDDGADDFCLDPWVRAINPGRFEIRWHAWSVPEMAWDHSITRIVEFDTDAVADRHSIVGAGAITQPRTLADGTPVAVRDDTGWMNLWVGDAPVIAEPFEHAGPTWGAGARSYAVSPDGGRVAVARNESGFGRLIVAEISPVATDRPRAVEVARGVHGSLDWQVGLVCAVRSGARTPTQIVVYDTMSHDTVSDDTLSHDTLSHDTLSHDTVSHDTVADDAVSHHALADNKMVWTRTVAMGAMPMVWDTIELCEPELIETADPVLHARAYRVGDGRMICLIHGGPTDQWQVGFMPRVAFWWSRGWDVLVVDPRGSTGHGRAYQQALRGRWGDLDVADTAALIGHAHSLGWAIPQTTVVSGSSSGGLSALGLAARFGSLIAGAMASAPVTDLAGLADVDHRFEAHYTLSLVGPPGAPQYRDNSPIHQLDQIEVPLLVLHGDADPVVPVAQSRNMVSALRRRGVDVEYHEFAGEGHGLRERTNRLAEFEYLERFARRVVSGSCPS